MYYEFEITTPDEVITIMRDLLKSQGWTIVDDCKRDACIWSNIDDLEFKPFGKEIITIPSTLKDGLLLAVKKNESIIIFRSMNGLPCLPESITKNADGSESIYADLRYDSSEGIFTGLGDTGTISNSREKLLGSPNSFQPNPAWCGVVMTSCTYYNSFPESGKWYDQTNVIRNTKGVPLAVGMPIPKTYSNMTVYGEEQNNSWRKLKMIVNYTEEPEISCIMTFKQGYLAKVDKGEQVDMDAYSQYETMVKYQYAHMAFAYVSKVGKWSGGTVLSGSFNNITMKKCIDVEFESATGTNNNEETDSSFVVSKLGGIYDSIWKTPSDRFYYRENHDKTNGKYHYFTGTKGKGIEAYETILFSMASGSACTTFVRADIDSAPYRDTPVLWASSTTDTKGHFYTGKTLGSTVVDSAFPPLELPAVPHYKHIQSQSSDDDGRNTNTLNNIAVDLPVTLFVLRDPDALKNYSQIGYVPNVYLISMKCIAPYKKYRYEYPEEYEHQVFPFGLKGGIHGCDGIAIGQEMDTEIEGDEDV